MELGHATQVSIVPELINGVNGDVIVENDPKTISDACVALLRMKVGGE